MELIQHPDITKIERTGYGLDYDDGDLIKLCPLCDEPYSKMSYEIDGEWICENCAREWVNEMMRTNMADVARELGIRMALYHEV